jgi:EPS-associated MarR family transcriptional regulator
LLIPAAENNLQKSEKPRDLPRQIAAKALRYFPLFRFPARACNFAAQNRLMTDEIQHRLFKILAENPHINQRELSRSLGISLGKANYCLKALIEKGWVKAQNFKNNKNKLSYAYLLTPSGLKEKARVTLRYLERKMAEYDELKAAVEELKREVEIEEIA